MLVSASQVHFEPSFERFARGVAAGARAAVTANTPSAKAARAAPATMPKDLVFLGASASCVGIVL